MSSLSQTESGRGGGTTQESDSVEITFENSEEADAQNTSKTESISLTTGHLLDPSPGREADRSLSIPSSAPMSSLESCLATSTPQERAAEQNMSLSNISSVSVGYGGTEEEKVEEKKDEREISLQVESETGRQGGGEGVKVAEEEEDSDATTVGGSDTECGDLRETDFEVNTKKGFAEPVEDRGSGEEHASSSSSSWRLVCSNTNTYSETKSSVGSTATEPTPKPSSSDTLHLCLSQDSELPDSQLPLMIDLPESQVPINEGELSSPEDETGPTAIAELAKTCCETSDNRHTSEEEKIEISSLAKGENCEPIAQEERGEGDGDRGGETGCELIREAWNLLQREKMRPAEALLSPMKSQQTQEESDDVELVTGEGEEDFSLRISQSQTTPIREKATPPPVDKVTPTTDNTVVNNTSESAPAPAANSSNSHPTSSGNLQPNESDRDISSDVADIRTTVGQDNTRACPKPVYESIALSESAGFLSSPLPPSSHSDPSSSAQISQQQLPSSTWSQTHGNEVSQASSSSAGTPFQFHLPQTGHLLQPQQYASPPSLHTPSPSPPPPTSAVTPAESVVIRREKTPNVKPSHSTKHPLQSTDEPTKEKTQACKETQCNDESGEKQKDKDAHGLLNGDDPCLAGTHKNRSRENCNSTTLKLKKFYGGNEGRESVKSPEIAQRSREPQEVQDRGESVERRGFVLGAGMTSRDEEMMVGDDSQNELEINIPGDSQFETSADSQRLLDCPIEPPSDPAPSNPRGAIFQTPPPSRRSKVPSSTPQPSTTPASRPQTSIFSNVLVSKRRTLASAGDCSGNRLVEVREDPFEFDSESHSSPAEFVLRRKKRKRSQAVDGAKEKEVDDEPSEENAVPAVHNDQEVVVSDKTNSTPPTPVITSSVSPSNQPQPHSSTPSNPPPVHPPAQQPPVSRPLPQTPSPHLFLPPHLTPASSLPLYSSPHPPFTSPASRVTEEHVSTASRGYRSRGDRYILRHTHTYRHVVEVKIVSQEVFDGDTAVDGLSTVWQVRESIY